ncbi:MAG: hypothetical protein IJF71_03080 [Clostridia bacterium]|nr:hypothetical protein [Clostridia bacterium]
MITINLETVVKLVYERLFFDCSEMQRGARLVFDIYSDGTIVIKEYKAKSRRVYSLRKGRCREEAFATLCDRIASCIKYADRSESYDDGASEELRVYYQFGRVQIVDRGVGNDEITIGEIMRAFLENEIVGE